jgi:hypothetical protein
MTVETAQEALAKALKASGRKDTQSEITRGLGDVIEKTAKITGVKFVADTVSRVTGKDCGCKERKQLLNKKFPFKKDQ